MPNYENLFAEHDAKYTASVLYNTWGHLDAKPGYVYPCTFLIASTGRECLVLLDTCELGGPAYYMDVNNYAFTKLVEGGKPEGIYRFEGTYQMYKKHPGNIDMVGYFKGRISRVKVK